MTSKAVSVLAVFCILISIPDAARAEELPIPTYRNSIIISIEHPVTDAAEVAYIKNNFPWGLYTRLSFSRTVLGLHLDWRSDWNDADAGIQNFKTQVDQLLTAAENAGVLLHPVICSGLARILWIYRDAKIEDVRNAQWYNDNKIAADDQIFDPQVMDRYVFGTLSRYARKMRRNLEAKSEAALAFLKQRMDEKPHVFSAISGWGEAELNFHRIQHEKSLQDWFCDYSPFAVLEFRDWIRHTGMYDETTGAYQGQGWAAGGARYRGANGLAQFNADFGTAFSSWDLKYFHWSLADDWDEDPTDDINNDPGRIPYAAYVHGGMMPDSGPDVIPGGFDPPRVMAPGSAFWDLWNLFRETMVRNFVLDMARWSHAAGIPPNRWYSHQIPGDYLFGTHPGMTEKNPRYHASASPLWTADVTPFGLPGATIYDVKFPVGFARTSEHVLPPLRAMSADWAALEYDAEAYPEGLNVTQSSVPYILNQFLRLYGYGPHLINFWRWTDTRGVHQIKGMNKEQALREFIGRVRDKARRDVSTVFTPPQVADISGAYAVETGKILIETNGLIWSGPAWTWKDWGDFSRLEVHRGTASGFAVGAQSLIGTMTNFAYADATAVYGKAYFYRLRAVNTLGQPGPASKEIMVFSAAGPIPALAVNRTRLQFGAVQHGVSTSPQGCVISNAGEAGSVLNWTAGGNASWIRVSPAAGTGGGVLRIEVLPQGLTPGIYSGLVTVEASAALNSPQTIQVTLNVYEPGASSPPFGVFDTPTAGVTVYGAVPVTGWALDDVEVVRVEIKRSPHPTDPPVVIGPDGLVYIGDAIFVEGSRPDVEGIYPNYPLSYRAGWGYHLLTNTLPDRGNGPFTLHAFAHDREGTRVKLGQKTVTGDNLNSKLPFGTIDTPAQGGAASGDRFMNAGWVLTPLPNMMPPDGSTMMVYVSGVPLGRPQYNLYRADIAGLFPEYANADGALGVFFIDTTVLENRVHTIAWGVADNAGNAEGIGSRYFTVQNLGGGDAVAAGGDAAGSGVRRITDLAGTVVKTAEPAYVVTGYNPRRMPEMVRPGPDGVMEISISEVERVEVVLGVEAMDRAVRSGRWSGRGEYPKPHPSSYEPSDSSSEEAIRSGLFSGYLVVGDELRPLPIGSTLDSRAGIFAWQPGPGFLGEYTLVFVRESQGDLRDAVFVKITIVPKF